MKDLTHIPHPQLSQGKICKLGDICYAHATRPLPPKCPNSCKPTFRDRKTHLPPSQVHKLAVRYITPVERFSSDSRIVELEKRFMLSPKAILSNTIAEIFATASATRILKYSEYNLLTAVSNTSVDGKELTAIKRLFHFVKKGSIQLVDDCYQTPLAA